MFGYRNNPYLHDFMHEASPIQYLYRQVNYYSVPSSQPLGLWFTLPETNSFSHLKIGCFSPKGKNRTPIIHFQGRAVSFREGQPENPVIIACDALMMRICYPACRIELACEW